MSNPTIQPGHLKPSVTITHDGKAPEITLNASAKECITLSSKVKAYVASFFGWGTVLTVNIKHGKTTDVHVYWISRGTFVTFKSKVSPQISDTLWFKRSVTIDLDKAFQLDAPEKTPQLKFADKMQTFPKLITKVRELKKTNLKTENLLQELKKDPTIANLYTDNEMYYAILNEDLVPFTPRALTWSEDSWNEEIKGRPIPNTFRLDSDSSLSNSPVASTPRTEDRDFCEVSTSISNSQGSTDKDSPSQVNREQHLYIAIQAAKNAILKKLPETKHTDLFNLISAELKNSNSQLIGLFEPQELSKYIELFA